MLKSIKSSFRDTLIYGFGNVAVKVVGLILIPIYTNPHYFSVDDFGVLGIMEISALVLTAFMASALPQSLTRWFWDKDYRGNQKGIFFMTFLTQIVVSAIFCLLLIPLSGTFSKIIFSDTKWSEVITFVVISSCVQSVNSIINTLMRLQSRSMLYTVTNIFKLTVVLLLTVYFIVNRKMGLEGIYLAQVIGNSLSVLILLGYVVKNAKPWFDKTVFKSMNSYGFPLYVANISAVLLNVIDRYSLNSMATLESVALYTFAFKITSVIKLVILDSMKLAIGPIMFRKLDDPGNMRFYSKVMLYSAFVIMFAIVGISIFSYEAIKVIAGSKEYWGAVAVIPILAISIYFTSLKDISVYGLHFAKKTKVLGSIVVFATVISLISNIIFIPLWGFAGSAVATLVSQLIYWVACYHFAQKAFFIPYELRKIFLLLFWGSVLSFSGLLLNSLDLLPRILLKTSLLISFPLILYFFGFYEEVELRVIRGFAAKWGNLRRFPENLKSLRNIGNEY